MPPIKPLKSIKCSFCGKQPHQVEHIISNIKVTPVGSKLSYICNECVDASHAYIHRGPKTEPLVLGGDV